MSAKILMTRQWPAAVEEYIRSRYDVTFNTSNVPMTESELREATRNFDVLCTSTSDQITTHVLNHPDSKVKLICNYGVGYEHIDVNACKQRNIMVTNTPDVLTDATAELAIMLMLMVARRASENERNFRTTFSTDWRPTHLLGTQVTGKTLGLIGFGRIAKAVAIVASNGLRMKVLYHSRRRADAATETSLHVEYCQDIDTLLAASDFVSLHCPGGKETEKLINAKRLQTMKRSAFLINTARGSVIDEASLINALHNQIIAGAGLDVYCNEPTVNKQLFDVPNVVLLPHIGSATTETRHAMGMRAVSNLEAWLEGREIPDRLT
jgi:lactate dehydrogenase-like 2-hydroxyacid dehydrogenase